MEQYRIGYIWKTLEGFVPNCGVNKAPENERLGRKCSIPWLFNCLPKRIREIKKDKDKFKELVKYLSQIPDQPKIGKLTPSAVCRVTGRQSNSLTAWIKEP